MKIEYRGRVVRFLPLLDSGADFSVFHKADALRIGLNWSKGEKIDLENADGTSFKARQFNLNLYFENYKLKARICFVDSKKVSMPLLGRRDIFKHFKITINEDGRYVELQTGS
ncbi:MAG: hypothetical protein AAB592_03250 [Patescibacteria group bacterium]